MQSIPFYILLKYSASLGFEFMFSFIAVIFLLDMQITSNLSDLAYWILASKSWSQLL